MKENRQANGFTGVVHVPAKDATYQQMVIGMKMPKCLSGDVVVQSEMLKSRVKTPKEELKFFTGSNRK